MSNWFESVGNTASHFLRNLSNRDDPRSVGLLAAVGSIAAFWALTRPSFDRRTIPKIYKAPKPSNDALYKYNVFPNGKLLDTPYGRINYYLIGDPAAKKKVLLVHGISTPVPVWGELPNKLVAAGYQVLMYDLYGRGYSDAPDVTYDLALFISQITMLLAAVPSFDKFDIIGMSLGGPIATCFSYYFPERINKVYLLCPAGGTPKSQLPLIRRLVLSHYNFIGIRAILSLGPLNPPKAPGIGQWQAKNHPGFMTAFIGSMAAGPIFGVADLLAETVVRYGDRLRVVWGDADDVVPMETKKYWGPGLKVDLIPGGHHWIVQTHTDQVAKFALAHFEK